MKLVRVALVKIGPTPENLSLFNRSYDDIELIGQVIEPSNNDGGRKCDTNLLLQAKVTVTERPVDPSGFLIVDETLRRRCEETIEYALKVTSVLSGSWYRIYSANNLEVYFEPRTVGERDVLKNSNGFGHGKGHILWDTPPPNDLENRLETLSDRYLGVCLMSEALSSNLSSSMFRDYMRLFENAFARPSKQLVNKLVQFLDPKYGYTRDEISHWASLRDPVSHADLSKSEVVLLERDINPVIKRVQQAAYDVLLNKKEWAVFSKSRRKVWGPGSYTSDASGSGVLGLMSKVKVSMIDSYGVYPMNLNCNFTGLDPACYPSDQDSPFLKSENT